MSEWSDRLRGLLRNIDLLTRRELPHTLGELIVLGASYLPIDGMSDDLRIALRVAAFAAWFPLVIVTEIEEARRRPERREASQAVAEAARALLRIRLSEPSYDPVGQARRLVTLRGVAAGDHLDIGGPAHAQGDLSGMRTVLATARATYAAELGAQMPFLGADAQGVARDSLRALERAQSELTRAGTGAWRASVLWSAGVHGAPLTNYTAAAVDPGISAGEAAIRDVVGCCEWLAQGREWRAQSKIGPAGRAKPDRRRAALVVASIVVTRAATHAVAVNWIREASVLMRETNLRELSQARDFAFIGQGRDYGWGSIQDMVRQEARFVGDALNMLVDDLTAAAADTMRELVGALDRLQRCAFDTGEVMRRAADVRVKALGDEEVAIADRACILNRDWFLAGAAECADWIERFQERTG